GVRIGRQPLAVDFLAEMVQLFFGQAPFQVGAPVHARRRMALEINEVAAVIGGLSVPEVVLATTDHGRQRCERCDVPAKIAAVGRIVAVGLDHHGHCVPAHVRTYAFFKDQIAREWAEMGERISFDYKQVKATRGNIYSDNGSLLATSLPFYRVAFDATIPSDKIFNRGVDSLAYRLSRFFGDKSKQGYKRMLQDARAAGKQYIILNKKRVDYQDKKVMATWPIFREGRLGGGVIFEKVDVRYNPFSKLSRRTIGFVNENDK